MKPYMYVVGLCGSMLEVPWWSAKALLMSNHNICFREEIEKKKNKRIPNYLDLCPWNDGMDTH